ncbi:non-contractile tail tubular protein [Vibrio phage vB_VpaP_1701]|nr:non-contractile tail tubular protein [Vibrio phage vB_VpaP_1701]
MARPFEGALNDLLQGVSQQIPRERVAGQCSAQVNMLSDPVTGIRRRPGSLFVSVHDFGPIGEGDALYTQYLERGADGRHLVINTNTGGWWLLDREAKNIVNEGNLSYLLAADRRSIQTTSMGGITYILNTEKRPSATTDNSDKKDPKTTGFYFVKSGAFSKEYDLSVVWSLGSQTVTYTTPDGTTAGDADQSVPEAIARKLVEALIAVGVDFAVRVGPYIYFELITGTDLKITSTSGSPYVGYSNQSQVNLETDLPARLHPSADGALCAVGQSERALVWYRYSAEKGVWLESGDYNSVTAISVDVPYKIVDDNVEQHIMEGRLAGDDLTNPAPTFLEERRITGIGTFQGRLVLLSGAYVCMSATGEPDRFFRSTVSSLDPTDRIDIASGSAQNSVFRQALQFNKDLILLGDSTQAVVPSLQQLLAPDNASVVLTSDLACNAFVAPVTTSQTLMYPAPRSEAFSAVLELVPSQYTSSQYVSQDVTTHIPRYIEGEARFMQSASAANIVLMATTGDNRQVIAHEYHFTNQGKVHQAWHKWFFPYRVASLHFARDRVVLFAADDDGSTDKITITTIDPKQGGVTFDVDRLPHLDAMSRVPITTEGKGIVPIYMRPWVAEGKLTGAVATGARASEEVAIDVDEITWEFTVEPGSTHEEIYLGFRYESLFAPTPPMLKDQNDTLISTAPVRLLRYELTTRNTGEFDVRIVDPSIGLDYSDSTTSLVFGTDSVQPDMALLADLARVPVPCRSNAQSTEMYLSTDGTQDMNILEIEYIIRYNQRRRRV